MKRSDLFDAVGFFVCAAAILAMLWIPTPAYPTDDHSMKEVEAYGGAPVDFTHSTCGGQTDQYGKRIAKWSCTMWSYRPDEDGDRIVLIFDRRTGFLAVVGWMYANGSVSGPAEKEAMTKRLHDKLHEARDAAPVRKSSAKKGVSL